MKLKDLGEFGLIERIKKSALKQKSTVVGIGDDCAVLEMTNEGNYQLITTDTLIEGIHFKSSTNYKLQTTNYFFSLGRKAMLANISDIAAMGGWPTHAVVTVGVPKTIEVEEIMALNRGLNSLAKKHGFDIVGGDIVSSPKAMVISITMLGEVEKENLLLRSTARVGDLICVTGSFGGPAADNFKLQTSNFKVRLSEARQIAKAKLATAMIDSSDGLVCSVLEICKASKVGAKIYENQVPIARGATLDQALYGGEEYELVFTAKCQMTNDQFPMKVVGEIIKRDDGIKLVDKTGRLKPLKNRGYEHFKTA